MAFGVDYSAARPSIATLKKYDVQFVCRYIAAIDMEFDLSQSEVKELLGAGIAIVPVFETYPSRALGGFTAGANDAHEAELFIQDRGLPKDSVIYFTVDFNPDATQMESVKEYFRGISSVHGIINTGVYGGYYTVRTLKSYGLVGYVWQTYAWSSGQWLASANIRQERNGVNWPEGQVDYDSSYSKDYGQYPRPLNPVVETEISDGSDMVILDLPTKGLATVLAVPAKAAHCTFHADPGYSGAIQPEIRVGIHPPWNETTVAPTWGNPKSVACSGAQEITVARTDDGNCPVTVEFTT